MPTGSTGSTGTKFIGLTTATGFKSSPEYTSLSPSSKATVDSYLAQHDKLLLKRSTLEAEKRRIQFQSNLTETQKSRIAAIDAELNDIASNTEELKKQTDDNLSTEDVARAATKQGLATQVIATVPPPPVGAYKIIHGIVQKGDLVSYMKFTQHLNPYGRKRQCDTDLENLMAVINKDFNNQVGEYEDLVKEITSTAGA
ncbi:MAG: hypothetical protein JHC33_07325 [Ignisphaera sp.]|nr:hypothetical protein [Ignisphaera sp.]